MRIPTLVLAVALLAAACGDDSRLDAALTPTTSTPPTTASAVPPAPIENPVAYTIGTLPDGYRAVHATDEWSGAQVDYGIRPCGTLDWDAQVVVTDDADLHNGRPGEHEPHVLADGTEVEILDMWDDGRPYGYAATWPLADGRWVTLRYHDNLSVDDLRAGIDSLVPLDAEEWARLSRALSIDTHVGEPDAASDDVVVALGALADAPASVIFHIPGDYPLGDDDCRRACFSLVHSGVTIPAACSTFPLVVRVDGAIVVAALLDSIVDRVWIDAGNGVVVADDARREVASLPVPGMQARFFVAAVPPDWCHFVVSTPDADFGTGLGEGGIPSVRPDSVGCDFDVEPVPYEPPDVCFETERDWVASTTSLREADCIDVPAQASTSTTPPQAPADDDG